MDSNRLKGIIMVIIGACLWGLSGTAAQQLFQYDNVSTEWLVTIRLLISGIILLIISSFGTRKKEIFGIWKQKSDAIKMILFGLFGMLAVQYTYFASIKEGNAAVATLLQYLAPIFITVYLLFKWNVRPSKIDFISITLSLVGTFLLLTNGSVHNLAVSTPAIIWGILSGLSLAFYSLYSKELLEKWSSSVIVGWGMIIGGYWCNDCTLYFYKRIHFIINYEICKTKYPTAHHICRHFRDTYCLLFILRQHKIPDSERNNIIWLHRTTRSYYFFCTYIARAISIFSVIRRFLCHCNGAHLKPKAG